VRWASLLVLGALAAVSAAPRAQQQQAPVFRTAVQTVPIYATVVDRAGRLVPDLEQEHFEVLDNGQPQAITLFRSDVQPISVVVALDTSGSMTLVLDLVKQAAEAFVLRMLPNDRARILSFDDKILGNDAFTSDRDALVRHLRTEVQFGNGTRLWDALDAAIDQLTEETSRKVVLVLSDGDDMGSQNADDDEVLARAHEQDVMIYAIGLRNRYRGGPNGSMIESRPDRGLKKLTQDTGGGYFELTRTTELNSTFSRVADELHRQYLMGFSPSALDGRVHKLDVRVKVAGMTARARKSYQAGMPQR
jgi:Ca-activated chloride channel family protein